MLPGIRFMKDFFAQERAEWPKWFSTISPARKILPVCLVAIYWIGLALLDGFRSDHVLVGGLLLALSYGGHFAGILLRFLLPVLLTGIVYDSMRFYADAIRSSHIHVDLPYFFDRKWFGIRSGGSLLTPNEFWQRHTHWILDLITGFFYLFFIAIYVLLCAYHALLLPRISKNFIQATRARTIGPYVTWAFFWVNLLGYSTYYWFPAAPPWYVSDHGLGPAKMHVQASAAGCLRFDELLGTNFFTEMYGRAADVFGAIPSLHVAYPLLSVLFAFYLGSARVFALFFYGIMCFSAVYLNHHYMLDILWGSAYAVIVFFAIRFYAERR